MDKILLKIATLNIAGLQSKPNKLYEWLEFVSLKNLDIIFLQETHLEKNKFLNILNYGYKGLWNGYKSNSRGVAILFKLRKDLEIINYKFDDEGCVINALIDFNNKIFNINNIYLPVDLNEKKIILNQIIFSNEYTNIIGGDFNFIENISDTSNKSKKIITFKEFKDLKSRYELEDSFINNNKCNNFTFKLRGRNILTRIDRFYISKSSFHLINNDEILINNISDHYSYHLEIKLEDNIINKRRKIMKILKDNKILKKYIHDECKKILKIEEDYNFINEWIKFKKNILELSNIIFYQDKNRKDIKLIKLIELKNNFINRSSLNFIELSDKIDKLINKKKIKTIEDKIIYKLNNNEKINSSFFNKSFNNNKDFPTKLIDENNNLINNNIDIINHISNFYNNLYNKIDIDMDLLNDSISNLEVLNKKNFNKLRKNMKMMEIYNSIKFSCTKKSPGIDGIPVEFYKNNDCTTDILLRICKIMNKSKNIIPPCFYIGLIKLIAKPDQDKNFINNWRPITLLNSDLKIITKAWYNRLKPFMRELICETQSGFIPKEDSRKNPLILKMIIDYCEEKNINSLIAKWDFKKAFDCISWDTIIILFKKLNYPKIFLNFISNIYNDCNSKIINKNNLSGNIIIKRGVCQGDPLSPFIFNIVSQILNLLIQKNYNIKGLQINNNNFKLMQFADDTITISSDLNDFYSIRNAMDTLTKITGLEINHNKTLIINTGKIYDSKYNLKFNNSITYLGIPIGKNFDNNLFWEDKINLIKLKIEKWNKYYLSMFGKILISKFILLSTIWYFVSIIPISKDIINHINKIIINFIWGNKLHLLNKEQITREWKELGFGIWNLELKINSLKSKWLIKYICSTKNDLFNQIISQSLELIKKSNLPTSPLLISNINNLKKTKLKTIRNLLESYLKLKNFDQELPQINSWILTTGKNDSVKFLYKVIGIKKNQNLILEYYQKNKLISTEFENNECCIKVIKIENDYSNKYTTYKEIEYKKFLKKIQINDNLKLLNETSNYELYKLILKNNDKNVQLKNRWDIDDLTLIHFWNTYNKFQFISKLKIFTFKCYTKSLPTLKRLNFNNNKNDNCILCNDNKIEDLDHILFECNFTSSLIKKLESLLSIYSIHLSVNKINFILSNIENSNKHKLILILAIDQLKFEI